MNPILNVNNLCVSYTKSDDGTKAVRDVSFQIRPGERFGIIGESGSGKSTICRAVMGHLRAGASGKVRFGTTDMLGTDAATLRRLYSRRIAMLPQGINALNPLISIGRHITETLQTHLSLSRKVAKGRALALLEAFQLSNAPRVYHAFAHQLSGGMARRAVMAVAFACAPQLVIADEPTRGLDAALRGEILQILGDFAREQHTALLIVTHDLAVAATCDRIGVLFEGRFVEMGKAQQVLSTPEHAYTQLLLDAHPKKMREAS